MEKPENQKEKILEEQYSSLINAYRSKTDEIKRLERRVPQGVIDKETGTVILIIDRERHETHLKLTDLGKQLGKDKDDISVDIIRKDATLDEYGLPEFSILTENDIIDTGDWHNPYYFNVDTDTQRPSTEAPATNYYK